METEREPRFLGRYIVADPRICHGKPTFRGTRVLESWGIRVKQIGFDIGRKGLQDEEIIPLLHNLRQPTLSEAIKTK